MPRKLSTPSLSRSYLYISRYYQILHRFSRCDTYDDMLVKDKNNVMKKIVEQERAFFHLPKEGEIVEGPIIAREGSEVYIDLGQYGIGIIYGREYYDAQEKLKGKNIGDRISAKIVELENENGLRELSLSEAGRQTAWQKLSKTQTEQELISVKIIAANRGGLMIEREGIEGFLPVSQLAPAHYPRVEGGDKEKILKELQKFVGENLEVRILDVDQRQNKFIVSEKAGEQEAIKKALAQYTIGDVIEGEITGVVEFGAFIRLNPLIEGLIHISELDWQLVQNPHDIVKVGDKIQAKIVDITADGRISLSLKALKEDPWKEIGKKYEKDAKVKAAVSKLYPYGAIVTLKEGVHGLVHISEFASQEDMQAKLEPGKEYAFKVLQVFPEERRIGLKLIK